MFVVTGDLDRVESDVVDAIVAEIIASAPAFSESQIGQLTDLFEPIFPSVDPADPADPAEEVM